METGVFVRDGHKGYGLRLGKRGSVKDVKNGGKDSGWEEGNRVRGEKR